MTEEAQKTKEETNTVFMGSKPFVNYVRGVATQFSRGSEEVKIKGRGKYITRAIDLAEVFKNREDGAKIKSIETGSEEFENKDGKKVKVSVIEITLTK